jgi:hypothetical protein
MAQAMEVNMKRLLWATPLLLVLISTSAWADSFSIAFGPNDGLGDNFFVEQQSSGMTVYLVGGTPFEFFNSLGYAPGSTLGGFTEAFLDGGGAEIDGVDYEVEGSSSSLLMTTFTLPTNGVSTVTEAVTLVFDGSAIIVDTDQVLGVYGSATGAITFSRIDGLYFAGGFATPEPGTIELIAIGLFGIFSLARRRLRISEKAYENA